MKNKVFNIFFSVITLLSITACHQQIEEPFFDNQVVLESNSEVAAYAIPNVVTTPMGTVLCFSTARFGDNHDWGNIQKVALIRSLNNGETWEELQYIAGIENWTLRQTSAIVDPETSKIMVFGHKSPLWNSDGERMTETWKMAHPDLFKDLGAGYFYVESFDEGKTWSEIKDIDLPYAPHDPGIVIKNGEFKGRYILPARTNFGTEFIWDSIFNGVLISDDKGKSWQAGGLSQSKVGEACVVELSNGRIYLNSRNHDERFGIRNHAISKDGGVSFTEFDYDPQLIEPICDAGMCSFEDANYGHVLLFSNPAVKATKRWDGSARRNMSVKASFDDGKTWPINKLVFEGPSAYSGIAKGQDGLIFLVYEHGAAGNKDSRQNLSIARFNMAWLAQPELLPPTISPDNMVFHHQQKVEISAEKGAQVYYSLDESNPDQNAIFYIDAFVIDHPVTIKAISISKNNKSIITEKKLIKSKLPPPRYITDYHPKYTASGNMALVDGIRGSLSYYDHCWQGFEGDDLEVILDLEETNQTKDISIGFLIDQNSWIFQPQFIEISSSINGQTYTPVFKQENNIEQNELQIINYQASVNSEFRYLKVNAKNIGPCPEWHKGAGNKAWLFIDEIIIE